MQNEMRNNCCDRDNYSYTHSCLQGHIVTSSWLAYNWKLKLNSYYSVSTSNLSSFLQLHCLIQTLSRKRKEKTSRAQHKFFKCSSEVDDSFCVWERKKTQHSALIAKLQYIYMRWVRSQETIGLLVLEYSLINPDIPYNRGNTDSFIPIDSMSKAERSFFLHQAVVCGCSSKRAQTPGRNGASGNPNRTGKPGRNQKTFELKLPLQAFH